MEDRIDKMIKKLMLFTFLFLVITFASTMRVQAQGFITGERIEGEDRYQTSIAISKYGWPSGSLTAILATGEDFPDALSAAPLARKYNAPILLTNPKTLEYSLMEEMKRLKTKKVYIVGGMGVVSKDIEIQLVSMGIEYTRLSGNDRYETSITVAREVGGSDTAVIATGENFPDALSIAPWAASSGVPILLTPPDKLPSALLEYVNKNNIKNTYVIGGTGVVSDSAISGLPGVQRIEGADRFGTNLAVLNKFGSQFNLGKLYLATGGNFPDALSGSALAALGNSPVVLTDKGVLPGVKAYMNVNEAKLNQVYFLGGDGVISPSAIAGVIPPVVTGINLTVPSGVVGIGGQLKPSASIIMIPGNAVKPPVIFSISNPAFASMDVNGTVTGISEGNTEIKAEVGKLSASRTISVRSKKLIVIDPGHGGWSSGAVPKTSGGTELTQYRESVLNMQIAEKLKNKLIMIGYSIVLTREGDNYLSLEDRAEVANSLNADIFISIHHDSYTKTSSGTSAFFSYYKPGIDTQDVYVQAYGAGTVYDVNNSKLGLLVKGTKYTYVKEENGDIYIVFNGRVGKTTLDYVKVYDSTPGLVSEQSRKLAGLINDGIVALGLPSRGIKDQNFAVTRLTNGVSVLVEVGFLSNPYEFEIIRQDSFQEKVSDKIVQAVNDYMK